MKVFRFQRVGRDLRVVLPDTLPFIRWGNERDKYERCEYRFVGMKHPRRGEYYVSGAVPAAYEAPNDLSSTYLVVEKEEGGVKSESASV